MNDSTLFGLAPREVTTIGVAPCTPIPAPPIVPALAPRDDGKVFYTQAIQAVARFAGYARRSRQPALEAKALEAIETLLELLPS